MKSLTSHKFSMAANIFFATCLAFSAYGSANVFDDAVFWFRGGKDCVTKDGYMKQGEFFDDLHADTDDHPNHSMVEMQTYSGQFADYKKNAAFQTEKVEFPALGTSVKRNMQVLHLSNIAINNKGTDYYWPQYFVSRKIFSENNISQEYSIVARMKLDEDGLMLARTQCVFRVGYDDSAQKGMWLGFSELDETTKTKYITGRCTPNSDSSDSQFDFTNMQIPTNTWFDMAVVVGNGKLRIGIAVPKAYGDNPTIVFGETDMWTANCDSRSDGHYRFFTYQGEQSARGTNRMDKTCFLGSVQQLAIWGRALSDQDVMAAFGMPRPAIFRTGFDNGTSNEFGGTRSGNTQTIDGLGSWQDIANTMQAGDNWAVNFNALRDEAGLPQIFSIKSLGDSAEAQIETVLSNASHNVSLGSRRVAANGRTFWPVPANLISEGDNTLIVKRTDDRADNFKMDAMELGGSLGVGQKNESIGDGRTAPARTATGVPSAADPNPQHWPQGLQPYTGITNLHIRIWVDPDVVDKASFKFMTKTQCGDRSSTQTIHSGENFSIYVNGESNGKRRNETEWQENAIQFKSGQLHGGWNDLEFISINQNCHWFFDYYRFETVLPRGFSLPPLGLSIILR